MGALRDFPLGDRALRPGDVAVRAAATAMLVVPGGAVEAQDRGPEAAS